MAETPSRPDSDRALPDLPELTDELTPSESLERLCRDQRQRWLHGQPFPVEAYLERYTAFLAEPDFVFALVWQEWQLREELGPQPTFPEYARLFPRFAERLRTALGLSAESLGSDSSITTTSPAQPDVWEEPAHPSELSRLGGLIDGPRTMHSSVSAAKEQPHDLTERLAIHESASARPAAVQQPAPAPIQPKWIANKYEVLGELGRGGMGVVYHALQHGLNRPVALKMILAGAHADPDDLQRFLKEAEAVAHLQHPNIVQVYEVGHDRDCPYFSMEYVEGGSLSKLIGGKPQPPRLSAELVEMLARAVHYAHDQGIVHRDLKPANVLLAARDLASATEENAKPRAALVPKIVDFGLAKRLDALDSVTRTGDVIGTPSYMAPEQARGERAGVGPVVDVYGLGTILYELLTGRPPFLGQSEMETIRQVLEQEPLPPTRWQSQVPRDLSTICLKCLQKPLLRRYATAFELGEDLRRFLNGEPIQARPVSAPERVWRWCQRRPTVAALSAALVLLFLGSFVGVTFLWLVAEQHGVQAHQKKEEAEAAKEQEGAARLRAEQQRQTAVTAKEKEAEALDAAERQLYFSRIALADRELASGSVANAEAILDKCPVDLRRWEWGYLQGLCHTELAWSKPHPVWATGVAFAGQRLVSIGGDPYSRKQGEVRFWSDRPGRDDDKAKEVELSHCPWVLACSPDGRLAAVVDGGNVRVWKIETARVHDLPLELARDDQRAVAFSRDGRVLAAGGTGVTLWDTTTGQNLRALADTRAEVARLAFSPDGKRLASSGQDHQLRIWDVATGQQLRVLPEAPAFDLAFSPDGQLLAAASSSVRVWETTSWQPRFLNDRHNGEVYALAFSPDGRWIASGGADRLVRISSTQTGREILTFSGHVEGGVRGLAFSPDGAQLVSAGQDGTVRFWDVTRHPQGQALAGSCEPTSGEWIGGVAFSAEARASGRQVLRSNQNLGRLEVFEPATDRIVRALPLDLSIDYTWPRESCAFSADGRFLIGPSASDPLVVKVWDTTSGQETATLPRLPADVRCLSMSPDHKWLAVGCGTLPWKDNGKSPVPGHVSVWRLGEGQPHWVFARDLLWPNSLAFSPNGKRLAAVGQAPAPDDQLQSLPVRVWNLDTGQTFLTARKAGQLEQGLCFSPDGKRLAVADFHGQRVRLLDVDAAEGGEARDVCSPLKLPTAPTWTTFSSDGQRLAVIGYDGVVRLFETTTGQDVLMVNGIGEHRPNDTAFSARVVFSGDGDQLACNTWDAQINVFGGNRGTPADRRGEMERRLPQWRLRQAYNALRARDRFALALHRRYLEQLAGNDVWLLSERGRLWAALGEWDRAVADLSRAAELAPTDTRISLEEAVSRLQLGDKDGYRMVCAQLRRRFGETTVPREAAFALRAWLLDRTAFAEDVQGDLLRWAELAVKAEPRSRTSLQLQGAVLYRTGRFAAALRSLDEALKEDPESNDQVFTLLVRALTQKQLGRTDEAKRSLAMARGKIDRGVKESPQEAFGLNPMGLNWIAWLTVQTWLEEAEALLSDNKKQDR